MKTILWKNYKIEAHNYSWDLYEGSLISEINKKTGKPNKTAGEIYWREEGFFVSLPSVLNALIRMEMNSDEGEMTLENALFMWKDMVDNFTEQCTVIKEDLKE